MKSKHISGSFNHRGILIQVLNGVITHIHGYPVEKLRNSKRVQQNLDSLGEVLIDKKSRIKLKKLKDMNLNPYKTICKFKTFMYNRRLKLTLGRRRHEILATYVNNISNAIP